MANHPDNQNLPQSRLQQDIVNISQQDIDQAVRLLEAGEIIALPTETVYGLAADASNPHALKKIFQAKNRPTDHPLIVHVADSGQLENWARDVPEAALLCAKHFWPGPLTLILKKKSGVSDLITGHQDTVGIRIPNHVVALAVLRQFGRGVAAPSANRFGRISPTSAEAVKEELGNSVKLILDGGNCQVGLESTILDLSQAQPTILRPGIISAAEIEAVLKMPVALSKKNAPRVSGALEKHYAPQTPAVLGSADQLMLFAKNLAQPKKLGFLVFSHDLEVAINRSDWVNPHNIIIKKLPADAKQSAQILYHILRELDHMQCDYIVIEDVADTAPWTAIRDRLMRLSKYRLVGIS